MTWAGMLLRYTENLHVICIKHWSMHCPNKKDLLIWTPLMYTCFDTTNYKRFSRKDSTSWYLAPRDYCALWMNSLPTQAGTASQLPEKPSEQLKLGQQFKLEQQGGLPRTPIQLNWQKKPCRNCETAKRSESWAFSQALSSPLLTIPPWDPSIPAPTTSKLSSKACRRGYLHESSFESL